MKKVISLILFVLTVTGINAQPKFSWSQVIEMGKSVPTGEIFGNEKDGFFIPRYKFSLMSESSWMLDKFDPQLKFKFTKELEIPAPTADSKASKMAVEKVLFLNGKLCMFASNFDKATHTNTLYAYSINANGEVSSSKKILDKIQNAKYASSGGYGIVQSMDSDKVLIYRSETYEAKANEKFHYKVVDAELNTIWEKSVTLPYLDKNFIIENYDIDARGNVVLQGKEVLKGEEAKGKADYKEVLLTCDGKSGALKNFDIDLGDKYISGMYFTFGNENNILIAGFYGLRGSNFASGYFFRDIDMSNQKIRKESTKEFELKMLKDFTKKDEIVNFTIDGIYQTPNGNTMIVADQNYSVTTTHTSSSGTYTSTTYYSNDILAFAIKPDGNIGWTLSISKKQVSGKSSVFQSVALLPVGNMVYLFYNDHPENLNVTTRKEVHTHNGMPKTSCLMMAAIDENGKLKKEIVKQPDPMGAALKPGTVHFITKSLYVGLGGTLKGDDSRICVIKI